jgi:hypothetical protein
LELTKKQLQTAPDLANNIFITEKRLSGVLAMHSGSGYSWFMNNLEEKKCPN